MTIFVFGCAAILLFPSYPRYAAARASQFSKRLRHAYVSPKIAAFRKRNLVVDARSMFPVHACRKTSTTMAEGKQRLPRRNALLFQMVSLDGVALGSQDL